MESSELLTQQDETTRNGNGLTTICWLLITFLVPILVCVSISLWNAYIETDSPYSPFWLSDWPLVPLGWLWAWFTPLPWLNLLGLKIAVYQRDRRGLILSMVCSLGLGWFVNAVMTMF